MNSNKEKPKKKKHFYDYTLVFIIILLVLFGLMMIYSASSYTASISENGDAAYYMRRQGLIALVGLVFMIIISLMDYRWFIHPVIAWGLYIASYLLMAYTLIAGVSINGQKRWINIGPIQFQTAEIVKIAIILFLAMWVPYRYKKLNGRVSRENHGMVHVDAEGHRQPRMTDKQYRKADRIEMYIIWAITIPLALLVISTNLSSGIIVLMIGVTISFIVTDHKLLFILGVGLVILAVVLIKPLSEFAYDAGLLKPYQYSRIMVWQDPESYPFDGGYQVLQGLYAIGSGGITGKGLGQSIQKLGFVPESQNDMIFSIICEELGFIGATFLILMYAFLIYRLYKIATNAVDTCGTIICTGIMAHISIQVIFNIAVVCNVMPNTGITLPFVSYGGTSVFLLLCEMGLALSVSRRIKTEE